MKRQVGISIFIALVTLVGLVLAQGMLGGQGINPNVYQGYAPGMMGGQRFGNGGGMMDMMSGDMMGGMAMMQTYPANAQPVTLEDAQARFLEVAQRFGPNVQVSDLMTFSNSYYARLLDEQGNGVAEVLVDRYSGFVYPEPGPNMMWNTRSGMMGYGFGGQPRYDLGAAQTLAETFLSSYLPAAKVTSAQTFEGYYTFDFGRSDTEGMLSVNAYSGEVWVHTWHGTLLSVND
jgi:hypothetical protein